MAERTVTVRLRALVDDYKRQMASAAKATQSVADQGAKWKSLGQSTAAVGDSLTRNVTLPIVAVGVAAVAMATKFDSAFVRMQSLAGVASSEVDGLKESVLGLAGETGRAPQELAEALYFLNSSGLDSAEAMEALEVSAKASAAGLGDTAVIADAVSSAMNAYAKSGLEAAEATDILVATARAGKAEPEQLAASLGQVLPIASELGVTFEDVGGAIASLSLSGNDASRSATLLQNVLSKLLKPSIQGAEALEEVGLSVEGLRDMLAEQGLLATLEELKSRLGDAGFVRFMEDAQAVQGALALTGENAEQVKQTFDEVADSAGATDAAFATWAESMGAENARAWAEFQATLIRVGDVIAPIASKVLGFVGDIASAFGKLPGGVQTAAVAFGLFAAAIGPVLSIGGRLVSTAATLYTGLTNLAVPAGTLSGRLDSTGTVAERSAGKMGRLTTAAGQLGITFGALAIAGQVAERLFPRQTANLAQLENALLDVGRGGEIAGEAADTFGTDLDKLAEAINRVVAPGASDRLEDFQEELISLGGVIPTGTTNLEQARQTIDDLDKALAKLAARDPEAAASSLEAITDALSEQGVPASTITALLDDYDAALAEIDTSEATSGVEGTTGAFEDQTGAVNEAADALTEYADAIAAQFDPIFAVINAQHGLAEAQVAVTDAQNALTEAVATHGPQSAEAAAAQQALTDAEWSGVESAYGLEQATLAAAAAAAEQGLSVEDATAKGYELAAQLGLTGTAADRIAMQFAGAAGQANNLAGDYRVNIGVSGIATAIQDIASIQQRINNLHGRDVGIRIVGTQVGFAGSGIRVMHEGGVIPGVRGSDVLFVGQAGEGVLSLGQMDQIQGKAPAQPITGLMPAGAVGGAVVVAVDFNITGNGRIAHDIMRALRTGEAQLHVNGQRVRAA